ELIQFPDDLLGIAMEIDTNSVGVALLGPYAKLSAGALAHATGRVLEVGVGEELLGRILDGAGRPIDEAGPVKATEQRPVERPAPVIIARLPVSVPLHSGIKAIDAAIPIGRGQRQLILGDRHTGKTSIAVGALLRQKDSGVIGIYGAIGQRNAAVAGVIASLREHGALERCVVVAAAGDDPPA